MKQTQAQQRTRRGKHGFLALAALAVMLVTGACRVDISFGKPAAAIADSVESAVTATTVPTATPTETPMPPTETPSPTPTAVIAAITSTPTATPLAPAQSPPDEIIIPAIKLTASVTRTTWITKLQNGQPVTVWQVPDYAAGWHINSALPGHGSNVVLSGHHNIKGEVFRDIVKLNPGDEIMLHADGRTYYYTVSDRFIIPERGVPEAQRRQNALWIMPTVDERLTLVTCYPYTDNSHRVIVIAKPAAIPAMAQALP